jgi:3-phenylpropionate/trans-cinnamate dioxygenase ferredoxin reductase subunit
VTVIEAADRVMSRVVAPEVSSFYEAEHAKHGVAVLCGVGIAAIVGADPLGSSGAAHQAAVGAQRVAAVRLVDGREIPADFVLVAVGVVATDALARDAGLSCDNGVLVDEYCRTSDPDIFAAGDCARHPSIHYGLRVRLESVDNAFEQGSSAALNMLGLTTVHDKVPWFWSDQFDLKMVIVGLAPGYDEMILRGDPAARVFSVCYLKACELLAVESVNNTKDQMAARRMIPARVRVDRVKLADAACALKDCGQG